MQLMQAMRCSALCIFRNACKFFFVKNWPQMVFKKLHNSKHTMKVKWLRTHKIFGQPNSISVGREEAAEPSKRISFCSESTLTSSLYHTPNFTYAEQWASFKPSIRSQLSLLDQFWNMLDFAITAIIVSFLRREEAKTVWRFPTLKDYSNKRCTLFK